MKLRKMMVHTSLLALAVLLNTQTAFAATKLGKIPVTVDYTYFDGEYEVDIETDGDDFYVDDWKVTEKDGKVLVDIQMYADEEYYFGSTSSGGFAITGGKFVSASKSDGNTSLSLRISMEAAKEADEELSEPSDSVWKTRTAAWSKASGAAKYKVTLFRDDEEVKSKNTTNTSYDFSSDLKKEGEYYFTVQAVAKNGETSDEATSSEKVVLNGKWQQDESGWWYLFSDETSPADAWADINGVWYYFDDDGYMVTDWQEVDGTWYFMEESGRMATGWKEVRGQWYHLDEEGPMTVGWRLIGDKWYYLTPSGRMATGWQWDGSAWYYLNGDGAMLANTTTPDGYQVDASGAWIE